MKIYGLFLLTLLTACSGLEKTEQKRLRQVNAYSEAIYRSSDEQYFAAPALKRRFRERYSWEDTYVGSQIKITREYFRCRGSSHNPPQKKQDSYLVDCGGYVKHSLPLKEGKEFVYPALIDLLNYIQKKTDKQVVITCGHRCPTHNSYADTSKEGRTSKHMIGAEVDFYVKGYEWSPEKIVDFLMAYYQEKEPFASDVHFTTFHRYEKETNVSTLPWFNKEIFIKLFKKDEGRDLDNQHRYPYVCIQLKWDRDRSEPVTYTWSKAFNGYLRY